MKKESKREIYARYGIEYENNMIKSPRGWIAPLLVNGNSKIGTGVYHFSSLPTNKEFNAVAFGENVIVRGTCPCHCEGCYATKGNYNYSSVINALAVRTIIAREYPEFMENAINAQIAAEHVKIIRIHASGDFFSKEYAKMWKRIAINNPAVKMWTYTKNQECENVFDGIENANIVKSIIPHIGVNFGHCDYILSCYEYLKAAGKSVYICRCGIDKNQHCINCKGCATHDYVLFLEHSTGYKAESDPLYSVLKAVIDAQAVQ